MVAQGLLRLEQGQFDEADRLVREGLDTIKRHLPPTDPLVAKATTALGQVLEERGGYAKAIEVLEEAVRLHLLGPPARVREALRRGGRGPATCGERPGTGVRPRASAGGVGVNELGSVALQRRKYDDAEAAYTRMRDIYRAVYPGGHYLIGLANGNLASVYNATGEFVRAESLFREAIAIYSERQSPEHLNTGIARIKLGRALVGLRRNAEAETELLAGSGILTRQTSPSVSCYGPRARIR